MAEVEEAATGVVETAFIDTDGASAVVVRTERGVSIFAPEEGYRKPLNGVSEVCLRFDTDGDALETLRRMLR